MKKLILGLAIFSCVLTTACNKFHSRVSPPLNVRTGNPDPLPPPGADCGTALLTWDKVMDTDLAGYKLYMGLESGSYSVQTQIPDPEAVSYTVNKLTQNLTYYFTLTAYDFAGNESEKAIEVHKTIVTCPESKL